MDYDVAPSRPATHAVNIPLAWAMFGGSTFILFLLCYFCQKKLQYRDDITVATEHSTPSRQVFVIPAMPNQQPFRNLNSEFPMSTPPPDYQTVVKKDCIFQDDPPPYDVAVSGDTSLKGQAVSS